jgi:primosomal protein N' (replication factor Y)
MFLEVALPLPLQQTFYYRCQLPEFNQIQLGQRVLVPFKNRKLTGFVINKHAQLPSDCPPDASLKEVLSFLDRTPLLSSELLRLSQWVSDYYFAPLGEVLKTCLPPKINFRSKKKLSITSEGLAVLMDQDCKPSLSPSETDILHALAEQGSLDPHQLEKLTGGKVKESDLRKLASKSSIQSVQVVNEKVLSEKQQLVVALRTNYREALEQANLTPLQLSIVRTLEASVSPLIISKLRVEPAVSHSTLRSLERKGILRFWKDKIRRDPLKDIESVPTPGHRELTVEQRQALQDLDLGMQSSGFLPVLLHGVTGSGKTEIYSSLIERMLQKQKDSLILMPEIGLTPRVAQEFRARLGHNVAILHSGLSDGERFDEWWRIKRGEAKVVIGTRSAVFAPLENLKLIVIDEEHDPSYKQHESPRYHARDTALVRGKMLDALVVLGSATPAVETFHNARSGKYKYIRLASRVQSRPLPEVKLVDMRAEFVEAGERLILSEVLERSIQDRLDRHEQILILLNRRGFFAFVLCRACGQNIQCKNCSISLTYHKAKNILLCHYCGYGQRIAKLCPRCGSEHLHFLSEGTEKVEALLEKLFPGARIARLDRDSVQKKNAHERILSQFQKRELDILLGTQMISKGHDFPNVTLVGILSADHTLSFPDFHSAERTFQLLSQMSGRAGRGDLPGEVIVQTYYPEHYCLKFVALHDYEGFYEKEMRFRQFMHYPPFTVLANILVRDKNLESAAKSINCLGDLANQYADEHMRILGPTFSPLARIKSEHRFQLVVKAKSRARLRELVRRCLRLGAEQGVELRKVHIDIDPVSLM